MSSDSDSEILKELRKLTKIITISNSKNLETELQRYATSDDRKKIWVLINGDNEADDIVKISGLKKSSVYNFLKNLEDAELVERQHGKPPKRILDYVPASWIELLPNQDESKQSEVQQTTQMIQKESEGDQNGRQTI